MPAADAPARRWRLVTEMNPGELLAGDTKFDVPVTFPDVPLVQPGDTQFDPNARLVWLQCANLRVAGAAPGVRGSAAKMLLRMSITPAGAAGGQS